MVPIGILSTIVFYAIGQMNWFRRPLKFFVTLLFCLITGASLFLSVVYFKQMIQNQNDNVYTGGNSWVEYPTINLWNGIMALKNVPLWSHILVNPPIGDLLPAYVPVRVYQGSTWEGYGWSERRALSWEFYTGEMSREDLRKFLIDNAISYMFYGPDEKLATKTPTLYPDILEVMYQNPEVTIYKVKTSAL